MKTEEIIKYSSCWEDADLLLASVPEKAGQRMLSIASGGDNSLSLLTKNPSKLVLVDMNAAQLHLCALKIAAFKHLNHEEMLRFVGVLKSENRKEVYEKIKSDLSLDAQQYWDQHLKEIEKGIIFCGKFERYLKTFRTKVLPFIHRRKTIFRLLRIKTDIQQECFYFDDWNTRRWRFFFKIFFSKTIMERFGRTKEYLDQVEVPVAEFLFERAEKHLMSEELHDNYFLYMIFLGHYYYHYLPHYMREENFESIKSQLHKIELVHGTAQEALDKYESYDFCNFSNIFEYMNWSQFESFERSLRPKINQGGVVSYWNLMVDRQFSTFDAARYQEQKFNMIDKGFFYKRFVSELVQA